MNLSVEGPRRTFMLQKIMNALVTLKQISSSTVFPYFCAFFVDISQEKFSMITAKICLQKSRLFHSWKKLSPTWKGVILF